MAPETIQIRLVQVEFLRPGPPHNQLLSPLTQYLAISGDAGAGVVNVPYEHAAFERRLRELRYETGDPGDRQRMLQETGEDMARILGAVPGLSGALAVDPNQPGTLIQLRLTLSASELALLPFEIAKLPISKTSTNDSWLSVQTRPPVCITRNIRTVSAEGVVWPERPRILFIVGDPAEVPYQQHRNVLLAAIEPFIRMPADAMVRTGDDPARRSSRTAAGHVREQFGELLTILIDPTLAGILRECRDNSYTHVHILTHGDTTDGAHEAYGLALRGDDNAPEVVSGERFATALISIGRGVLHRPTVVTVASCDAGNVGTVIIPGASFAHALHQAGIPLVVASQFPLSKEGSIPFAETMYRGLLWGENPLVLLQQLRTELHARYTSIWHDWASLVVYEALPAALNEQLEKVRYAQAKRAIYAAFDRSDAVVRTPLSCTAESLAALDAALDTALGRLPTDGPFAIECIGLRASASKRRAERAFRLCSDPRTARLADWRQSFDLLNQSYGDYERAIRGLFVTGDAVQRVATLHWVLVQAESLSMVLGRPAVEGRWSAAKLSAELYLDHDRPEARGWAHASLAELWLIRLGQPDLSPRQAQEFSESALRHAGELDRLYPWKDDVPISSTRQQFLRYVHWWGSGKFEAALTDRKIRRAGRWQDEGGIVTTAAAVAALLHRHQESETEDSTPTPRSDPSDPAASLSVAPGVETDPSIVVTKATSADLRHDTPAVVAPAPPAAVSSAIATDAPPAPLLATAVLSTVDQPRAAPARSGDGSFVTIEMLPAGHGDCLWIEYGSGQTVGRWLYDCGTQQTARELMRRVAGVPENQRCLELFVMSHIDSDHIGGALPFFRAVQQGLRFGDVWFNGWRHVSGALGARQGEMFSTAIQDFELPWNLWRNEGPIVVSGDELPVCRLPGGMTLTLLSPLPAALRKLAPVWVREMKRYGLEPGSRVDYSRFLRGRPSTSTDIDALADTPFGGDSGVPNGTSIALLAEYAGCSVLFGADAHAPVLVASIRSLLRARGQQKLTLDAFKVSHHGSQNNVSSELIQLLDCRHYLLSTNGDQFHHPDRQAIARILKYGGAGSELHFNYRSEHNAVWEQPELQEKYGYRTHYPAADDKGLIVSVGL